jgi:oligo-1,6-glucosidase
VYGTYDLILENNPSIFAYVRTYEEEKLLVIANFTADECVFELPEDIVYSESELLIHNYDLENVLIENITLRPYEAMVFKLK